MRLYDITVPIENGMPVWPGDPAVRLEQVSSIAQGANANVSSLACGVHVGTHVDASHHFLDGASTVEALPLDVLLGKAYVADLRPCYHGLASEPPCGSALWTEARYSEAVVASLVVARAFLDAGITPPVDLALLFCADEETGSALGAEWLVRRKIRLIAVDYLSVAPYRNSRPTHQILLSAGVVVVEGVDLSRVPPGSYTLYCLPMKLVGSDGAPARAVLARA